MYFDVEDHRPDTPRVSRAISLREAVLWTVILHLLLLTAVLLTPPGFFVPVRPAVSATPAEDIHYVTMASPTRMTAAKKPAPVAGLDHPSPPAPKPVTPDVPRTPTPAPDERAKGPESNAPPAPPNAPLPTPMSDIGSQTSQAQPSPGGLGNSIKNLQKYLQGQNAGAPQGGNTEQDPGQFEYDPKGVDFNPWFQRFKAQVVHNWDLPMAAQTMHGHVKISMAIYRDGRITDIKIVAPSDVPSFNTAAVNALHRSNPTIPIPKEYPVEPFLLTVTFFYNENIR